MYSTMYTYEHKHTTSSKMENVVLLVLSTFIYVELHNNLSSNHWKHTHTHTNAYTECVHTEYTLDWTW